MPELAEKWSWQDGYRNLVFFLRKDVKWHDGRPFTSKDVKYTFDMVREAPEAQAKLRVNPRKDWYANVEAIEVGIDKWVGTIEGWKDADLSVFSRHPLDPYTVCEKTIVDGKLLFDRAKYLDERRKAEEEKNKKEAEAAKPKEKKIGGEV